MKSKENIPEEIPGMSRKMPFSVPDYYFDEFPSRIQERLSETPMVPISRTLPMRRVLAVAAMFIGLLTIGYFGLRTTFNGQDNSMLSGEETETAIEYFVFEFDDEMLVAAMVEADMELGQQDPDYETDVIIEYLTGEEIDVSEIFIDE